MMHIGLLVDYVLLGHELEIHTLQMPKPLSLSPFKYLSRSLLLSYILHFLTNTNPIKERGTEAMNRQSLKRFQFRRWGKRIGNSTTTASAKLGNSEERTIVAFAFSSSCFGKPPRVLVKQFVWRLKSRLRLSRKSDTHNIQCSYDLRSYHLNFDDGWSRQR